MEHKDPPTEEKKDDKEFSSYVSPRLRSKIDSRYDEDEEEKSGAGGAIAIIGLIAVIVLGGGALLLGSRHQKQVDAARVAAASQQARADSIAQADSLKRIAMADSVARAETAAAEAKDPKLKAKRLAAEKAAAKTAAAAAAPKATPAAGTPATAGNEAAAAPPPPARKFGIAVGDFLFDDKAAAEKDRLASATSLEASVVPKVDGGTTTYTVVLGSFDSKAAAEAKGAELLSAGTVKESRVIPLKKK